jgi:hypothetical protein
LNTKRYGHTEKQRNKKDEDEDETHKKTMRQIKEVHTEIEMQRFSNTKRQRLTQKQRDKVKKNRNKEAETIRKLNMKFERHRTRETDIKMQRLKMKEGHK